MRLSFFPFLDVSGDISAPLPFFSGLGFCLYFLLVMRKAVIQFLCSEVLQFLLFPVCFLIFSHVNTPNILVYHCPGPHCRLTMASCRTVHVSVLIPPKLSLLKLFSFLFCLFYLLLPMTMVITKPVQLLIHCQFIP